jgi:O-antigen/teichoic acid export membrane protein
MSSTSVKLPLTTVTNNPIADETPGEFRRAGSPSASMTVFRGAALVLSTQPLTWAATLLTIILVPRYLGAEGLGQAAFLATVGTLVGSAVTMGVPQHLVRTIAGSPRAGLAEAGSALALVTTVAMAAAIVLSFVLPMSGMPTVDPIALQIVLAGMVIASAQSIIFCVFNGRGRHGRFAWLNLCNAVGGALLGVLVLRLGGGLTAYLAAAVIVSSIVTLVSWKFSGLWFTRENFDPRHWLVLSRASVRLLGNSLALQIRQQAAIVVAGLLLPAQAVGWFTAALRIISLPVFIPTAIITSLLPVLSRRVGESRDFRQTLMHSIMVVLLLTFPISALMLVLAPEIPSLLHWGPEFFPSILLMRVLAFQQPLVALDMVLGTALVALKRDHDLLVIASCTAVLNPTANFVLIPVFQNLFGNGILAAAIVELATECLFVTWSCTLLRHDLLDRQGLRDVARVVMAGCAFVLIAGVLSVVSVPLAVAGGATVYIALLLLLRVVRLADLANVKTLALAPRG